MKVTFGDREWALDVNHVSYKHAMGVQSHTGMSIGDWLDQLDFVKTSEDGDILNPPAEWLKSMGALYWLMRAQNGETVAFADVDFDVQAFTVAYVRAVSEEISVLLEEQRAQQQGEGEPDPTPPSPTASPASRTSATPKTTTRTPRARQPKGAATAS